jgi:O-acetyl-ADP-ribose deacetylase (regulator of RNase III)
MIEYRIGDILTEEAKAIVNTVNCEGVSTLLHQPLDVLLRQRDRTISCVFRWMSWS